MRSQSPRPRQTWVKHHRRRNLTILGLAVALLIIVGVGLSSLLSTGAQVGQTAPDFTVQDINNSDFHLFAHKGQLVFIEFMRTSCHFCTQQAPILSSFWSDHRDQVVLLSISIDPTTDQPSVLSQYATTYNMPWTWVRDINGLGTTYGITGTPTMFLLDKNCVIRYRYTGVTDLQTLNAGVQSLL